MNLSKLFSILMLVAAMAFNGMAAEWYVSQKGGNNRNAGNTPDKPFKNIQKALDKSAAGDVIKVAEGNYFGTMNTGNIIMTKGVSIIGGYSPDFAERDFLKYQTKIQPDNKSNKSGGAHPLLRLNLKTGEVTLDGLLFDKGESNNYHGEKGVGEGVGGMLLHPPSKFKNQIPNAQQPIIAGPTAGGFDGNLLIQNCLFLNGNNCAIRFIANGNVVIKNSVFVGNVISAVELFGGKPKTRSHLEFAYNTVLFTWARTKELTDMGYAVRAMTRMDYNIHNNIIGFSSHTGIDAARDDKERRLAVDNNIFLLNKKSDLLIPYGGTLFPVFVDMFADVDMLESAEGNTAPTDMSIIVNVINKNYADGFLSATYKETAEVDEDSPAAQFRAAMGLNKQGTIKSNVSMYGNKYPFDDAIKLFGAVPEYGAQLTDK